MKNRLNTKEITTDVLIIGGGTAGCYAALVLRTESRQGTDRRKANIRRSGCLAAGVNAINAYIVKRPQAAGLCRLRNKKDAAGIVRQDLLLTAAENFNEVTAKMENLDL